MKKIFILPLLALILIANSCANSQAQNTNLKAAAFAEKIKELPQAPIIDVRSPEEFSGGHLPNALNIDWNGNDFEQQIAVLDKSKAVLVYCLSGGRSGSAAAKMRADGFKEVYELEGGMMKWRAAQLPETKDGGATKNKGMSRKEYDALVKTDKIVLIDFYAEWCQPCKKMKPYLDEISAEMGNQINVIRINADENTALCQDLSVDALPTIFIYKKGTMMWHNVGYVEKAEILKYLK